MTINHNKKTIQYSEFELVAAVNYIEHVVEQKDRKTWKLVPEVKVTKVPLKRVKKSGR